MNADERHGTSEGYAPVEAARQNPGCDAAGEATPRKRPGLPKDRRPVMRAPNASTDALDRVRGDR